MARIRLSPRKFVAIRENQPGSGPACCLKVVNNRSCVGEDSDTPALPVTFELPVGVQRGRSEPAGDPAPLSECLRPTDESCVLSRKRQLKYKKGDLPLLPAKPRKIDPCSVDGTEPGQQAENDSA